MHFQKYTSSNLKGILKHYTREHITDNVDREKIKDNKVYSFTDNNTSAEVYNYIQNNLQKRIHKTIRRDAVELIDLIVTQPQYLGDKCDMDFFKKIMQGLNDNYIAYENIVMAAIHQDEQGQPHMHFSFMPIVKNEKGEECLSAKKFLNINFLKKFHKEMEEKTGYTLTSEDKSIKNLTMQQYQNKKDIEKLQKSIAEQKNTIADLQSEIEKKNYTEEEKEQVEQQYMTTFRNSAKWKLQPLPSSENVNMLNYKKYIEQVEERDRQNREQLEQLHQNYIRSLDLIFQTSRKIIEKNEDLKNREKFVKVREESVELDQKYLDNKINEEVKKKTSELQEQVKILNRRNEYLEREIEDLRENEEEQGYEM